MDDGSTDGRGEAVPRSSGRKAGQDRTSFKHIYSHLGYGLRAQKQGVPGMTVDEVLSRMEKLRLRLRQDKKVHANEWRRFVDLHGRGGPTRLLYQIAPHANSAERPNRHSTQTINAE